MLVYRSVYIYMVYIGKSSSKTDGLGGTPHFKKPPHIYIYIYLVGGLEHALLFSIYFSEG